MEKKIIFVLRYTAYEGSDYPGVDETIAASFDIKKLEKKKFEIEVKSEEARAEIEEKLIERNIKAKPHQDKLMEIRRDYRQHLQAAGNQDTIKIYEMMKPYSDKVAEVYEEFIKWRDDYLSNLGLDYFMDNPEESVLYIEEVEVI